MRKSAVLKRVPPKILGFYHTRNKYTNPELGSGVYLAAVAFTPTSYRTISYVMASYKTP